MKEPKNKTFRLNRFVRYSAWAIFAIIFALAPCGVINHGDGEARYAQTKALLLYRSLSIPPEIAYTKTGDLISGILLERDGKFYSKYGIGTSLVWVVPATIAWFVSRLTGVNLDVLAGFGISFVNPVIVIATAGSMIWTLREFGVTRKVQLLTVLLYILGTSILANANTALSEPLVGLLLLWAIVLPVARPGPKAALISGGLLTCCILIKPEFAPLPACLLPLFLGRDRRRSLIAFCAAAAVGGLLLAVNNFVYRGSVMHFSYGSETSQFQAPWTGLTSYFAGINRNIVLFNPALLLATVGGIAFWRTSQWKRVLAASLLVWLVYLPFYASWWAWDGGMCFGPRFFQSFVPFTCLSSGLGLVWLVNKARGNLWAAAIAIVLCLFIVLTIPMQIAGLCIKNEQAVRISRVTGRSEPWTHLQLMVLKLSRGIKHPEVYHKSDFTELRGGDQDTEMDFRTKRTFQYLNHWWSIYVANKVRHTSMDMPL
jgi:hypothetical protein